MLAHMNYTPIQHPLVFVFVTRRLLAYLLLVLWFSPGVGPPNGSACSTTGDRSQS